MCILFLRKIFLADIVLQEADYILRRMAVVALLLGDSIYILLFKNTMCIYCNAKNRWDKPCHLVKISKNWGLCRSRIRGAPAKHAFSFPDTGLYRKTEL